MNPIESFPGILIPDWKVPAGIGALTTARLGGVSSSPYESLNLATHVGDQAEKVEQNRLILAQQLPEKASVQWLDQVHGITSVEAGDGEIVRADACWTSQTDRACAVMTADCLPILVAAKDGSCVSAIHAGWRGLAAGVIESAIQALPDSVENLTVWLGPAIGPCHFEVGEEVRHQFLMVADRQDLSATEQSFQRCPKNSGKFFADLYQLARIRLARIGVQAVSGGGLCSYCDQRFFSYRASTITGRMATLIWKFL